MSDVLLPLGSRTVLGLSFSLLTQVKAEGMLWSTACLPVCLGVWGPRTDFYYCQTVAGLLMWGTLSDERMGLFTISAGPHQCSHSRVLLPRDSGLYFIVWDSRLPQPGGPDFRIYIPGNSAAQLYSHALDALFVVSYDLTGIRCSYSNPPPHGKLLLKVKVTLLLAVYANQLILASSPLSITTTGLLIT
jgi:hypothetical protein